MFYSICGLVVEMAPKYKMLTDRAEKYLIKDYVGKADISILISKQEILDYSRAKAYNSIELAEYVMHSIRLYNCILDFDGFFLHSSAVALDGKAYLFTANCGGGKSTHSKIWRRVFKDSVIINDDKPVIRKIDGKLYVCGTPFSGKHDINANLMLPIAGIYIIIQSPENRVVQITPKQAMPTLLEQTLRNMSAVRMGRLLELFDELLCTVPVFNLYCNMDNEAALTSYNAVNSPKYTDI